MSHGQHGCCADKACTDSTCMELQAGKTCGHCVHERRCCLIFGHKPTDTYCDWFPRRFHEKPAAGVIGGAGAVVSNPTPESPRQAFAPVARPCDRPVQVNSTAGNAGVPACPESGKHCMPVDGQCETCGALGANAPAGGQR